MSNEPVCRGENVNPNWWFSWPGSENSRKAKQLCMECPLYWGCQEYALREGIPEGIFGGLDGRDRDRIWHGWPGGRPRNFDKSIDEAVREARGGARLSLNLNGAA